MKYFFLLLFIFLNIAAVYADPLADLQAAIIQADYKSANNLARELLKERLSRGQTAQVEYYLGLSYLRLGEYAQGYDVFRKLLSERPSMDLYDKASVGMIDALYMQGQYDNALKESLSLMARRNDSELMSLIYLKVARANLKLARWSKSREFLQKIVSEYSGSFEADVARGLLDEKQYFAVQVGSFTDKFRAEKLMKELLDRKEYAYIIETKSPEGREYYRVRAGQLTALKDAQELEKKLSGLGYPTLIYP